MPSKSRTDLWLELACKENIASHVILQNRIDQRRKLKYSENSSSIITCSIVRLENLSQKKRLQPHDTQKQYAKRAKDDNGTQRHRTIYMCLGTRQDEEAKEEEETIGVQLTRLYIRSTASDSLVCRSTIL